MGLPNYIIDGDFTRPKAVGPRRYEYPFRKNGDRVTALFQEEYWQTKSKFVPAAFTTSHDALPDFYLIAETEPTDIEPGGGLVRFVRTYSRIPQTQTVSGSRFIPKPEISGEFPRLINGVMVDQPDPDISEWTFISQQSIISDSWAPSYGITGGTYTVTFEGDTTAGIAYDATAGTLETALNGLTSVQDYGSVTVTGSHTAGFTITWATYDASTVDTSSLGATGATIYAPSIGSGKTQRVVIQPIWSGANYSVNSSSITPAAARPLTTTGGNGQLFKIYNYGPTGTRVDGGTFTISGYGQTTAAIDWDATIAEIRTALNLLSEFTDRGGANVSGLPLNESLGQFWVDVLGQPALTSGTFTLTVLGDTTSGIAYNANIATISTAVNALAGVTARGGATISGPGFANGKQDFTITFANIPAFTGSAASLTPSGASIFISTTNSWGLADTLSFTQNPSAYRYLSTDGAHGITTSDDIYVDSTLVEAGEFTVPDSTTIALLSSSGLLSSATTFTTIGASNGEVYVADSPNIPVKLITYFYLPGVTAGIDSVDDITLPARGTTSQLLGAIFGGTTTFNYEVGELTEWRESPIKMLTITTINPQHLL